MKFQEVQNKFKNKWTYQAQFFEPGSVVTAKNWLESRHKGEMLVENTSIYLNDLQAIFELRLQFDKHLKSIRRFQSHRS